MTGEQLLEREHVSSELPMLCETAARLEHDQEAHDDSGQECAAQGVHDYAMDRLIEDEIERRGYVPGPGSRQQQGVRPARDRAAIFNKALADTSEAPRIFSPSA